MTYREALDWIYSFSDTERTGAFVRDREDNLRRERELLRALGEPHTAYSVTHVAGTKGKGSTSMMIANMLQVAGVRVGLYTQPDLHTFRERMRVDGVLISEDEVTTLVPEVRAALARIGDQFGSYITYEVATALAFLYFQRAGVRHAVVEVGLGGRLDATNVVSPAVSVITSISFDHMQVLGDTLGAIATEKAGIVKQGVPVVSSAQAPEAHMAIERICAERHARLWRVGPVGASGADYTYQPGRVSDLMQEVSVFTPDRTYAGLELGLLGTHQLENAAAAVAAVDQLSHVNINVSAEAIRVGLREARWPARMQVVSEHPRVVIDGAHNADSMEKLGAGLRRHFAFRQLIVVLGVKSDKDIAGIALAVAHMEPARVYVTAEQNARALTPSQLRQAVEAASDQCEVVESPEVGEALRMALDGATADDLVCVTGSLYLSGEALRWMAAHAGSDTDPSIEIAGMDH